MVLVSSTMLQLGTCAPDFDLPDVVSGNRVTLNTFSEKKALLVMFICRHCPYVKHIQLGISQLARDYAGQSVGFIAISANDPVEYPADAPESLKEMAEELGWQFPYAFDETQGVAKAYTAACTPDFFLFDGEGQLVYRGQFDDSRPGNPFPVTGKDIRAAIDAVLCDDPVNVEQKPSIGCNIKWKSGNEPLY